MKRRFSQFTSFLLLHSSWGLELKWLCNPVLSCHSCVLAWFACPIGVFVHFSSYQTFPFLALGMVFVIGALFGRLLCGWVCPFGFLQDMLYKIPGPKFEMPKWTRNIKYVLLVGTVFITPLLLGEDTMYSFCRLCPASALQVTIPNIITGGTSTISTFTVLKLLVLTAVLVLAMMSSRSFCQMLCPIGALLAPLNHFSFWSVKPPTHHCGGCHRCDDVCPTNVEPSILIEKELSPSRKADCVVCHDCQPVCPNRDCMPDPAASK